MTSRRLWVPALAGLLVAVLLGPAGVTAVEPRTVTASIMISPTAFNPTTNSWDYNNPGAALLMNTTASGYFAAPLSFPVPVVNIKRITLYASDNNPVAKVCVSLYRVRPAAGTVDGAGGVCTVDSPADPQTAYTTAISPKQVNTAFHGPTLRLSLDSGVTFYGVKITYSYTSTP